MLKYYKLFTKIFTYLVINKKIFSQLYFIIIELIRLLLLIFNLLFLLFLYNI